jgi:uncharacterized membrane-anchored protein YitT (DUF2179 family)
MVAMKRLDNISKRIKDYIWIIVGSIITALAVNIFLVPYKIAPGGVTGIATVIYYLSAHRFHVGTTMLILNIPLFIFGLRFIGGRFILRTLFSTVFLSAVIDTTEPYIRFLTENYLFKSINVGDSPDLLLYSIFGGFFMGVGLGLVFRSGATTGGTDLAARIVKHFAPSHTMGKLLLLIDSCVIVFASIAFNSLLLGLYSIISLYICSKIIDSILEGFNFAKAVFIISDKSDEIANKILIELDRGVTALKGTGMYTGRDKNVLYCVLQRGQLALLKTLVKGVDPGAFVILTDIREVLGEGFKSHD